MGRHSAGDDDGADVHVGAPVVEAPGRRGRHSRTEDAEETGPIQLPADPELALAAEPEPETEPIAGLSAMLEEAPVEPQPKLSPPARRPARGTQSTAADLELLRRHPDLRARVIAAVVVPFVLFAAVLLLIRAPAAQYLVFIWIPLVSAGVLAGLLLDVAHRRRTSDAGPPAPES